MLRGSGSLRAAISEISSRPTWSDRLAELAVYAQQNGDCNVPKAAGPLGRWVARQRELARKDVLSHERCLQLNALGFVWNTNEAAWEIKFAELVQWVEREGRRGYGRREGACVPIASGDLGVWVAKQRQLRRKGKLSPSREKRLDDVGFVWDTAAADWEEKFAALLNWKERNGGDTRVPFNSPGEDGLGWWVATQRQALRKGKMSEERKARLDNIGFCWNPTETPRRGRSILGRTGPRYLRPFTSVSSGRPEQTSRPHLSMDGPLVPASASSFESGAAASGIDHGLVQAQNHEMRKDFPLPAMRGVRQTSNKRRFEEAGVGSSKRHHSFTGDASNSFGSYGSGSGQLFRQSTFDPSVVQRMSSFSPMCGPQWTIPQPGVASGSTTPASESTRTFSGTGAELVSPGNYHVGSGDLELPPLVFDSAARPSTLSSISAPNSDSGTFTFGKPVAGSAGPILPPVSSIRSPTSESEILPWNQDPPVFASKRGRDMHPKARQHHRMSSRTRRALTDLGDRRRGADVHVSHLGKDTFASAELSGDRTGYAAHGTSWQTAPSEEFGGEYSTAAETLADLSRLDMSENLHSEGGYHRRGSSADESSGSRNASSPESLASAGLRPQFQPPR